MVLDFVFEMILQVSKLLLFHLPEVHVLLSLFPLGKGTTGITDGAWRGTRFESIKPDINKQSMENLGLPALSLSLAMALDWMTAGLNMLKDDLATRRADMTILRIRLLVKDALAEMLYSLENFNGALAARLEIGRIR